jgi:hypothetical protein
MNVNYRNVIEAAFEVQPVFERKAENKPSFRWDSPVETEELLTSNGAKSGIFAVVANRGGNDEQVVGKYSKGETLTSNREMTDSVESALSLVGWDYKRTEQIWRDGSGFTATYNILTPINGLESLLHSPIMPQLKLHNSYDGLDKKYLEFAMEILKCLNGAIGFLEAASMAIKHSKDSLSRFAQGINGVIEQGKQAMPSLASLGDMAINDEQAVNLFTNIARANSSKNAISDKTALTMLAHYFAPDENESRLTPSLWRAYMAGTRAMRDLAEVRPTQAQAANAALGRAMSFALSTPKQGSAFLHGYGSPYAALIAPPSKALVELN